jgi:hypothetical protein
MDFALFTRWMPADERGLGSYAGSGMVARSADGQIEPVNNQVLDSMLLNELQKQNSTIAAQQDQIGAQQQQIRSL